MTRFTHGPEAEARRLHAYDGQSRSDRRHLTLRQFIAVVASGGAVAVVCLVAKWPGVLS